MRVSLIGASHLAVACAGAGFLWVEAGVGTRETVEGSPALDQGRGQEVQSLWERRQTLASVTGSIREV